MEVSAELCLCDLQLLLMSASCKFSDVVAVFIRFWWFHGLRWLMCRWCGAIYRCEWSTRSCDFHRCPGDVSDPGHGDGRFRMIFDIHLACDHILWFGHLCTDERLRVVWRFIVVMNVLDSVQCSSWWLVSSGWLDDFKSSFGCFAIFIMVV